MARAYSVWVVVGHDGSPLAAFTVKHEMATWLAKNHARASGVYRLSDGARGATHVYPVTSFL